MSTRISFDFYGDVQVDRTLVRIIDQVEDATPAWEEMADQFASIESAQFASEGAHASGGWAPLSPAYADWKAKNYPGRPIMQRTRRLVESLTRRPFGIEQIAGHSMVIGSDVAYGKYHQLGDGVPQRRVVELTEHARRDWVKILQRHVMQGVT